MKNYQVRPLLPEQRSALAQFYKRNQYQGKVKANDNIWIMTDNDKQIVGAARLCRQAGFILLRGVWIEQTLRAQGLGSQFLQNLKCAGILDGCYCFPYLHLESFYRRLGFCIVEQVPASLQLLLKRYNRHKVQVLLMQQIG